MIWVDECLTIPMSERRERVGVLRGGEGLSYEDSKTVVTLELIEARDTANKAINKMMGKL